MKNRIFKASLIRCLVTMISLAAVVAASAQIELKGSDTQRDQKKKLDFSKASSDLLRMSLLFRGGNGEPATFDSETAESSGFDKKSVALAEEMAAFTNDVMKAVDFGVLLGGQLELKNLNVDIKKYDLLNEYFTEGRKLVESDKIEQVAESVSLSSSGIDPKALNFVHCATARFSEHTRGFWKNLCVELANKTFIF